MTTGDLFHLPDPREPGINTVLNDLLRNCLPLILQYLCEAAKTRDESVFIQSLL